jgi:hypothetical protein
LASFRPLIKRYLFYCSVVGIDLKFIQRYPP